MQFPSNFNLKPANIFKIAGLTLIAIIVIVFVFRLIGSSFSSSFSNVGINSVMRQSAPTFDTDEIYSKEGEMAYSVSDSAAGLSIRNVVSPSNPPIDGNIITGDDAEEFEVTEYRANIETRYLEDTCNEIIALKLRDDVIFENTNEYEKS